MSDDNVVNPALVEMPAAVPAGDPLLTMIARAASDPATDVEKFERLMALYDRHQEREASRAYHAAMAVMQPELPEIEEHGEIKDRAGKRQSTYAKWEDMQEGIKPILARHGFALTFAVENADNAVSVTAKLSHRAGHTEQTTKSWPLDTSGSKNIIQAHGSTVSYGMRYTAIALLNLTSRGQDDDGQAGGSKLIDEAQQEALLLAMQNAKMDPARFCKSFGIPAIDQLPAAKYKEADLRLQDYLLARQQREAQQPEGERGK